MYDSIKITILGAGLMGCGIAHVFAQKNIHVTLHDPIPNALASAKTRIIQSLLSVGESESKADFVTVSDDFDHAVSTADIVIEAAPEKLPLKRDVFARLQPLIQPHCIVASNTSVIPIKDIVEGLSFNGNVVGTHWWNPAYLIPLVEVVQSEQSSLESIQKIMALLRYVGKEPVHVQKDVAGFVGNRLQHALWREAIALIDEGVCSAETVDLVVKNSFGLRLPVLGPIENADLVGLDLTLDIHNVILSKINSTPDPASVLKRKVSQGHLGMKSGEGFKSWTEESAQQVRDQLSQHLIANLQA